MINSEDTVPKYRTLPNIRHSSKISQKHATKVRSLVRCKSDMTRWQQPSGPLNVWKTVEGYETLEDGTKQPVKFSIQEVPNDHIRHQEVLDHMCTYFLKEEPLSKSTDIKNDPDGVEDFKSFWKYSLAQGATVGCYKLNPEGKIGELVGANALFIVTDETVKDFDKLKTSLKSKNFKKIYALFEELSHEADAFKIYNVDRFISSISLSVLPVYRGQKLGYHMLDARSEIAKKYELKATCTMFTAKPSQLQAERAGFKEEYSLNYVDYVDDKGNPLFPNISSKCVKMMGKTLP